MTAVIPPHHATQASGCDVPDWMLQMKPLRKDKRQQRATKPLSRKSIRPKIREVWAEGVAAEGTGSQGGKGSKGSKGGKGKKRSKVEGGAGEGGEAEGGRGKKRPRQDAAVQPAAKSLTAEVEAAGGKVAGKVKAKTKAKAAVDDFYIPPPPTPTAAGGKAKVKAKVAADDFYIPPPPKPAKRQRAAS